MESAYLDNLILRLCKQPRTFEFISMEMSGCDPVELHAALKALEQKKVIINNNGLWYVHIHKQNKLADNIDTAKTEFFNEHIGFFGLFDKPHPLDFEWRNTTGSLDYLIKLVRKLSDADDSVLFLGFPTLFATACLQNVSQKITLIEKNKPIVKGLQKLIPDKQRFRIKEADIFKVDPATIGKYRTVIMDPPWYSPHFYQFMWLAAQCVELGGTVGISLPPLNTRPDIPKERIDWFAFCLKQGLCLENLFSQKLHYAMPFFEFNAFRAAGIQDILPFWRKGDLALFRKVDSKLQSRPVLDESLFEWVEKEIDSVRIRIKIDKAKVSAKKLQISSLIKGDILPSISSRDPRREDANVWTSGNRIYKVNDSQKLLKLIEYLNKATLKSADLEYLNTFLGTITKLEKKEYNNYLDWLYHEMERQTD